MKSHGAPRMIVGISRTADKQSRRRGDALQYAAIIEGIDASRCKWASL
jgi:hypothetical protein